jgi:hypothetical protein
MPGDNSISIQLTNHSGAEVSVNTGAITQTIGRGHSRYYQIQQETSLHVGNTGTIQIDLVGEEADPVNPSKGMCFCLGKNATIILTPADSLAITILKASEGSGPGAVNCGDGTD